jgi:hypothetical protein
VEDATGNFFSPVFLVANRKKVRPDFFFLRLGYLLLFWYCQEWAKLKERAGVLQGLEA